MTLSELPVEILHQIFTFLSSHEIFWGLGICCQRLLDITYEAVPKLTELPIHVSKFEDLIAFFRENVFPWNEIRDVFTTVIVCDSIDNAERIYQTSKYISSQNGMALLIANISFASDLQVASLLSHLSYLRCIFLDSLDWSPSDDFFIELDQKHVYLECIHIAKASKITDDILARFLL